MTVIFSSGRVAGDGLRNTARRRLVGADVLRIRSPDWVAGVYALGDRVIHTGRWWESTAAANATEPGTPAADWVEIS